MKMKIKDIIVSDRIRKDLGDIEDLASDIETNGLINPIVVNKDNRLLAGERRLEAVKSLGWVEVPVTVMDTTGSDHELAIEISENESRKDFSRAERAESAKRMLEAEKKKAEERRLSNLSQNPERQNSDTRGRADEEVASQFGISRDTLRKEIAINENKDLLEPEDFADWDEGRLSTNKAYQLLKERLAKAEEEKDEVKRILQSERVEGIKARKQMQEENAEQAKEQAEYAEYLAGQVAHYSDELHRANEELETLRAAGVEPQVIERVVEVEKAPDDYEFLKDAVTRSEAEQARLFEEGQEKSRKIRELEEQLGRDKLLQDADRDVQSFTAITLDYIRRYGGHVWSFEQLSELSEPVRMDLVKAVKALNSFTGVLLQNLGGVGIE